MPKRELNLSELFSIVISMDQDEAIGKITAIIEEKLNDEERENVINVAETKIYDVKSKPDAVKTIIDILANQLTEK